MTLAVAPLTAVDDGVRRVIEPPYPVLADPDHEVAEAYGVYNLLGNGYAAPAVFIIDADGEILWSYVGQSRADRPRTSTVLENLP